MPIALLDVLGRSVLQRVVDRMRGFAISAITVLGDVEATALRVLPQALEDDLRWVRVPGADLWWAAQQVFANYAQSGAEFVVVTRVGPYSEIDYDALLQSHLEGNSRITAVSDAGGQSLDTFVVSAARRDDADFLLQHQLRQSRVPCLPYRFTGYGNRLATAADLRQLAVDSFDGCARIVPAGEQIRPGIWAGAGARIQRGARILAPAFIGARVQIGAAAVITRGSVLEHHVRVNCGTVVEDSTLLPYTSVGAGLDVAHAVVGFRRFTSLPRRTEIEIFDSKLVGYVLPARLRALGCAVSLFARLPSKLTRGWGRNGAAPELSPVPPASSEALSKSGSLPVATGRD
jgi:hypothetical protein